MSEDNENLYDRLEREALFRMADEPDEEPPPDLLESMSVEQQNGAPVAADLTLGGYIQKHTRPPAFEGVDGQPYTVDIDTEATNDAQRPFAAFLLFIRWAATGAGIMEHAESPDVAFGETPEAARDAALELTLYEVKSELDAAIARRKQELEE